jgi:hypothetical protein
VKADKSNIRPMHQDINVISITREHHVFLSEAYQPIIPTEEAEPIESLTDKQAMDSPQWEKWHVAKVLENTALAHKKMMVLVDIKPRMTVMKSKYVFKIKEKFGKISRNKARLVAMKYDQEINPQLNSTLHQLSSRIQ